MTVTQRGQLTPGDERRLLGMRERAEYFQEHFRAACLEMVAKSSFREVERVTGISTNTLQRWKREAKR